MLTTNSHSLKHIGQGVGRGEQGTTGWGNEMYVAGLSSRATICNFGGDFSPRPSSSRNVQWQRKDNREGNRST